MESVPSASFYSEGDPHVDSERLVSDELHGEPWDIGFGGEILARAMGQAGLIALDVARSLLRTNS